jgi:hypothetical protein
MMRGRFKETTASEPMLVSPVSMKPELTAVTSTPASRASRAMDSCSVSGLRETRTTIVPRGQSRPPAFKARVATASL